MSISTRNGLVAAWASARQDVQINKLVSSQVTTTANGWYTALDLDGIPGPGSRPGTSTTAGVVPDDSTVGFPPIAAFAGGATGYIDRVQYSSSIACRMRVVDVLFKAGAYAFNASQTLSSQPSYSARLPTYSGSPDYKGTQIWVEAVTTFTGNPIFTITYTNENGVTGRSSGSFGPGLAPNLRRMILIPLQSGDNGVQKIESVTCITATVGTFNVLVVRPLYTVRSRFVNDGNIHGPDQTGFVQVFDSSALMMMIATDSTSSGNHDLQVGIVNG